jgi:hypothetical protein
MHICPAGHDSSVVHAGRTHWVPQQIFPELQPASWGQLPQFSPNSIVPLPHVGEQSLSLFALHPGGQYPSLLLQEVIGVFEQDELQGSPEFRHTSLVDRLLSLQPALLVHSTSRHWRPQQASPVSQSSSVLQPSMQVLFSQIWFSRHWKSVLQPITHSASQVPPFRQMCPVPQAESMLQVTFDSQLPLQQNPYVLYWLPQRQGEPIRSWAHCGVLHGYDFQTPEQQ